MSQPTVLILGGLAAGQDATRHLLPYLCHPASSCPAHLRPRFVRVVDKFLCIPSANAYTTYVDDRAREVLKRGAQDGTVEYLQGNLLTQATRDKVFCLPASQASPSDPSAGFDYILDFTGEPDFSAPSLVHAERTVRLALCLGQSAVKHRARAYVRLVQPFYKLRDAKKDARVGEEGAGVAGPWGRLAGWWHEAARGLANMEDLPLVLLRPSLLYGPATLSGLTPRLLLGELYLHASEQMDFLWSDALPQDTCHAEDFAAACVYAADWIAREGLAGIKKHRTEVLAPAPALGTDADAALAPLVALGAVPRSSGDVKAVVFNASDDGRTRARDVARAVEQVVPGVKTGFHGAVINKFAKMNLDEAVEDANDKHLDLYTSLLSSLPPSSSPSPLSPQVPADFLAPHPLALDNAQLKKLTGWAPRFAKLDVDEARRAKEGFRNEGTWPCAAPNYGHDGCPFGEYRGRHGYCSRHRYEDDDYYGGFKKGFPHKNWKYGDDSGHGYSYDHDGNGPPDWCPDGWQYYGRDIGWAPYKGWQPPHKWKPPVVFLKVIVKITWWSPPKDWCDFWQNKWEWYDYKIPSWWDFSPRKGGYKA
ncbi:hypothetical protein JCM10207_004536 [Rhodosporidiobolus poonsookiae]